MISSVDVSDMSDTNLGISNFIVVGHQGGSMAACMSEYTLEFFTLLNAKGKKELIEWGMKEGLIVSSYECPKCNERMGLYDQKSVDLDGFEWRCQKKV
ncbi:uncharacterized protein TNCV_3636621 [Trichonephila clavipes]|nr:uncharacterized protein TNCV_3636621 [Trichonephila clavipes]